MSKMKDSGVQWIGKIPSNWIVNRLRYNCNFKTQKRISDITIWMPL